MSKKNKRNSNKLKLTGRAREKYINARKKNDRTFLFLMLMVIAGAIIGSVDSYNLATASGTGFAVWFLRLLSYPGILLLKVWMWIGDTDIALPEMHPAMRLGVYDISSLMVIWLIIKLYNIRRKSIEVFKITTNILTMLIYWGAFQIACSCLYIAWHCNKEPSSVIPSNQTKSYYRIITIKKEKVESSKLSKEEPKKDSSVKK
jgi:hypothetical protein